MVGIIMFFAALIMLLFGFPVAFTFAAVSVLFGIIAGIVEIGFDDGIDVALIWLWRRSINVWLYAI